MLTVPDMISHYWQVSTADPNEYKVIKVNLKRAISDLDQEWGSGSEWTIVYIRPMSVDSQVGIRSERKFEK
jgi:hypothetical protein